MYDIANTFPFEWERPEIKENFIQYDLSSMPEIDPRFEKFTTEVYELAHLDNLINVVQSEKTYANTKEKIYICLKSILWTFIAPTPHIKTFIQKSVCLQTITR
jgi:hypothetical protein